MMTMVSMMKVILNVVFVACEMIVIEGGGGEMEDEGKDLCDDDDDDNCAVAIIAEKVSYHSIALSMITSGEAIGC